MTGRLRVGIRFKAGVDSFAYSNDHPFNPASLITAMLVDTFKIPWEKSISLIEKLQTRKPVLIECTRSEHKEFCEQLHAHGVTSVLEDMYVQDLSSTTKSDPVEDISF